MAGKVAKSASRQRSASKGAVRSGSKAKKASGVTKRIAKPKTATKAHHHTSACKPVVVNELALGNITSQPAGHHVAAKAKPVHAKRVAHHKKSATKKVATKKAVTKKTQSHKAKGASKKRVAKKVAKK